MLILGVETSVRDGSVALLQDGDLLQERRLPQRGRRHAQSLVFEVKTLFEECGVDRLSCDGVAVSIGPGSFTGLRVGVVFAKTLAYVTRCRVAAVDTFEAVAANSPTDVPDVWVIGNAQRSELFVGRYQREAGENWTAVQPVQIHAINAWCKSRTADDVISGPGVELLAGRLPAGCRVLAAEYCQPTAAAVARIGHRAFSAGRSDDFWALEPVYHRKSAAEEKRENLDQS